MSRNNCPKHTIELGHHQKAVQEGSHPLAASSRTMPAPRQSTRGNGCSELFPHRTPLQIPVHAIVLYGRTFVHLHRYLQESLEKAVVELCSFGSTGGLLHGGCAQRRRQRLALTFTTVIRGNAGTTSHAALSWSRGICLGLAVFSLCVLYITSLTWDSVRSSVIQGCGDLSQIHLQVVMKVKVREYVGKTCAQTCVPGRVITSQETALRKRGWDDFPKIRQYLVEDWNWRLNSPLGLRGVGGDEGEAGKGGTAPGSGGGGLCWVVCGCIANFPKLSSIKQHTFIRVSRIRNLGTVHLGSLARRLL